MVREKNLMHLNGTSFVAAAKNGEISSAAIPAPKSSISNVLD